MRIGIIGSGNIGTNAARLFVRAGHEVAQQLLSGGIDFDHSNSGSNKSGEEFDKDETGN